MNTLLSKLGVPPEVQAFFHIDVDALYFWYGDAFEHFGDDFHLIPTTTGIWMAGSDSSREVIVTTAAMEAVAFLAVNMHRYRDMNLLTFLALGNLPCPVHFKWMLDKFPNRKFTLVFADDLLGRLFDVRVGAALHKKQTRFVLADNLVHITCEGVQYDLEAETLSLNAFEKASRLRTGVRTFKPKEFNTFLDQLKNEHRS